MAWHDISHSKNVTTCIVNVKINTCNIRPIGVDLLQLWEIRIDECLQMWHGQVFLVIPPNVVSCLHLYFMFITCDPITKKCMLITGVNYYTTIYIYNEYNQRYVWIWFIGPDNAKFLDFTIKTGPALHHWKILKYFIFIKY